MTLPLVQLHPGDGPPILLLHGFTQNSGCWEPFARLLAEFGHRILAVDLPGHGSADPIHDSAGLWRTADLVAETLNEPAHLIGYSMGGRVALHVALAHPQLVRSLTLIGATAGLETTNERETRQRADDRLADRLMEFGLSIFLDEWLAQPLFANLDRESAHVVARLTNRPEGLAASLRNCGTGSQENLWPRLTEIEAPIHVVVGERDAKFTELGTRLEGQLSVISEAGHTTHLEQPQGTADVICLALSGMT
jgi:2-succinyl-6-hydroxy-2,4-cyclohexadiene-1-carboxylate synthase